MWASIPTLPSQMPLPDVIYPSLATSDSPSVALKEGALLTETHRKGMGIWSQKEILQPLLTSPSLSNHFSTKTASPILAIASDRMFKTISLFSPRNDESSFKIIKWKGKTRKAPQTVCHWNKNQPNFQLSLPWHLNIFSRSSNLLWCFTTTGEWVS